MSLPPDYQDAAQFGHSSNSNLHVVRDNELSGAYSILDPLRLPEPDDKSEQVLLDLAQYWHDKNLEYDMHSRSFRQGGELLCPSTLAERVWRMRQRAQVKVYMSALYEIVARHERLQRAHLKGRLLIPAHDRVKAQEELAKFVELVATENCEPDRLAFYRVAFAQLIWQVKRRLRGLPAYWQVMPILVGPQGTGKSSAVKKLARPLDFLYMENGEVGLFADRFRSRVFSERFLITFDEIGSAAKELLESVKRVITSGQVGGRKIYSSDETLYRNNASFIGTSNYSIVEKLADPTGMRRFAEIQCRKSRWTLEYGQQMAALDYHLIWQAETGDDEASPMQHHADLVERFQAETVMPSHFDYWAQDALEATGDDSDELIAEVAYQQFKDWMIEQMMRPPPRQRFVQALERRYGHRGRTRTRSALFRRLKLTDL